MAGNCGECTACCRMMSVDEINKPRLVWCPHIAPNKRACTIYEKRPEPCHDWECGWLSSQHSDIPLPADMRPDKSHVVIAYGAIVNGRKRQIWFHTDPGYPRAWREGNIGLLLNKLVTAGHTVIASVGRKYHVFDRGMVPQHFWRDEPPPMRTGEDDA